MNICEGGNRWVLGSSATVRQQHQPLDLHTLGTGTQRCKVHRLLEILAGRYILIKLFPVAAVQICDSMYRTHWTGRRAVPACRSLRGPRGSRASPPCSADQLADRVERGRSGPRGSSAVRSDNTLEHQSFKQYN